MEFLNIKKLREIAILPGRATEGSAGYDLYACLDSPVIIKKGETVMVHSGIAIEIPSCDYAAFVFARSGLASKHGITLANSVGVIDSDYRGEIIVPLINLGTKNFTLNPKERFAQMVFMPVCLPKLIKVNEFSQTKRGESGFGSTGMCK